MNSRFGLTHRLATDRRQLGTQVTESRITGAELPGVGKAGIPEKPGRLPRFEDAPFKKDRQTVGISLHPAQSPGGKKDTRAGVFPDLTEQLDKPVSGNTVKPGSDLVTDKDAATPAMIARITRRRFTVRGESSPGVCGRMRSGSIKPTR